VLQSTVRFASKKASGANRNKQEKTTPKRRGPKKYVGDYVEKGMILYKQLGLKYYPGENVSVTQLAGFFILLFVTYNLENFSVLIKMLTTKQKYPFSVIYRLAVAVI